jgi:hypothetical protein
VLVGKYLPPAPNTGLHLWFRSLKRNVGQGGSGAIGMALQLSPSVPLGAERRELVEAAHGGGAETRTADWSPKRDQ